MEKSLPMYLDLEERDPLLPFHNSEIRGSGFEGAPCRVRASWAAVMSPTGIEPIMIIRDREMEGFSKPRITTFDM